MNTPCINVVSGSLPRITLVAAVVFFATACGGESGSQSLPSDSAIPRLASDDDFADPAVARELAFSVDGTAKKPVFQCFCDALYRSTLLIYHFLDQQAVLMIEFDNSTPTFAASAEVHLFPHTAIEGDIAKWINNQHSDGLFLNPVRPMHSISMAEAGVSIISAVFDGSKTGYAGDTYDKYQIEFSIASHQQSRLFNLNGFTDHTDVYLETSGPTN